MSVSLRLNGTDHTRTGCIQMLETLPDTPVIQGRFPVELGQREAGKALTNVYGDVVQIGVQIFKLFLHPCGGYGRDLN